MGKPLMEKQLEQSGIFEQAADYARYSDAAEAVEPALCCPGEYSRDLLKVIPEEVLQRDYGYCFGCTTGVESSCQGAIA